MNDMAATVLVDHLYSFSLYKFTDEVKTYEWLTYAISVMFQMNINHFMKFITDSSLTRKDLILIKIPFASLDDLWDEWQLLIYAYNHRTILDIDTLCKLGLCIEIHKKGTKNLQKNLKEHVLKDRKQSIISMGDMWTLVEIIDHTAFFIDIRSPIKCLSWVSMMLRCKDFKLGDLNYYFLSRIKKKCSYCNKENSRKHCGRCYINYCSVECQKEAWNDKNFSNHQVKCERYRDICLYFGFVLKTDVQEIEKVLKDLTKTLLNTDYDFK